MFNFKWFSKQNKQEGSYVSNMDFKEGIKALGMGRHRGITIVYLLKPKKNPQDPGEMQPIYHFWRRQDEDIFYGEADTYEELKEKARADIDALLDK